MIQLACQLILFGLWVVGIAEMWKPVPEHGFQLFARVFAKLVSLSLLYGAGTFSLIIRL